MIDKSAVNVLVVDDESFMLKLNARALANLGYTSVTVCEGAARGLEAMDCAASQPDLILLDLNMPDIDGVEFVRHLVKRGYSGSLILVSGEDDRMLQAAEKLVRAHQITALGYLHKPLKPEALAALLNGWEPVSDWEPASELHAAVAKKTYSGKDVAAAIANGELVNYYQPKVSILTGQVVGVETLVRWKHPLHGLVFPDQFIGVAEEHGMIQRLTRTVIADALTQSRCWREETGLTLGMAINISMDDLQSLDFVDYVVGATTAAGVQAKDVTLEVTESGLIQELRVPLEVLTRLRLKRIRLSLDDFGTGHSSLSQLRDLPFDELKIDQGFIHGSWGNETLRAIFDTSVLLAKQLGMQMVAEGVEDRADWDFVRKSKCDAAQGYFIAKPMPAEGVHEWIEDWEERTITIA